MDLDPELQVFASAAHLPWGEERFRGEIQASVLQM